MKNFESLSPTKSPPITTDDRVHSVGMHRGQIKTNCRICISVLVDQAFIQHLAHRDINEILIGSIGFHSLMV